VSNVMMRVAFPPVRRVLVLVILSALAAGCGPVFAPPAPPAPTPTPFRPANLLTPRPTAMPTATPQPTASPDVAATTTPVASPTPLVTIKGTLVKASEPLLGFLVDDRLDSPIIGESFKYRIYLPPDYVSAPTRRYPVLYMLHGTGGNYTEWSDSFLPEQIDRLIATGEVPPMIVVMPDDGESTYYANWTDGPRWADYLTYDVVNTIDERYRTIPEAASRGIGGLSMGGLGALNLAFQHPDVFGVVGAHSPSVRLEPDPMLWFLKGDDFWHNNPIWLAQNSPGLDNLKIWLDDGDEDVWLPNIEAVHDAMVQRGLQPVWHVFPGPHEAEYWIEHVPDYLHFYGSALKT
jgi:enterochelin esterase-like enzyme